MIGIKDECTLFVFIAGATVKFTFRTYVEPLRKRNILRFNKKLANGKSLRILRRILKCDTLFPVQTFSNRTFRIDPNKNQEIEIIRLINKNYDLELDKYMWGYSILNFIDNVTRDFEMIKFLVNEFNVKVEGYDETPIHKCIDEENTEVLKFLAGKDADLDHSVICKRYDNGCIHPLIYAIREGKINMANKLIDLGSDIDFTYYACRTYRYSCPLYEALVGEHYDLVDLLLLKGAEYDEVLANISNPQYIMYSPKNQEILERKISDMKHPSIKGDPPVNEEA
jgi:hypothetical protein